MKTLLLLSLLFSLLIPFQGPIVSSDASPLTVANFKWSRARRKVDAPASHFWAVRAYAFSTSPTSASPSSTHCQVGLIS